MVGWFQPFSVGLAGGLMGGHINGYIEPTEIAFAWPRHLVCIHGIDGNILEAKELYGVQLIGATIFHLFKEGFWTYLS